MAIRKILKNDSLSDIVITRTGLTIPSGEQIELVPQQFGLYSNQNTINELTPFINSGDLIINDGNLDMSSGAAIAHLEFGTVIVEDIINLFPGVGENAPEMVTLNGATPGYKMEIGDNLFANDRFENIIGEAVVFKILLAVDNDVTDRFVSFDIEILTTNGADGKSALSTDSTLQFGPFEIPDNPFEIFTLEANIPSNLINESAPFNFFGGTRTDVTNFGELNPTNDPVVISVVRTYRKRIGAA